MKKLTIKNSVFANWYFNTGADDEQEATRKDIGKEIADYFIAGKGCFEMNLQRLLSRTNTDLMPANLFEEFSFDICLELGELLRTEYEIKLIEG